MTSSALTHRRHTWRPPAVCRAPPPLPIPPVYPAACSCTFHCVWDPPGRRLSIAIYPDNNKLPAGDDVAVYLGSYPRLEFSNPYTAHNQQFSPLDVFEIDPGIGSVTITAYCRFSNATNCHAHTTVNTP